MRYLTLALAFTAITTTAGAQTSGTIRYNEVIKMDIDIEGSEYEALLALLPKEQKIEKVLYFTSDAALYQPVKKDEKEYNRQYEEGGAVMNIRMDVPDERFYTDLTTKTMVQQRDMMGRKFLIQSAVDSKGWKLTGRNATVLNYPCQEAVMQDDEHHQVKVWFTPALPVGVGPHRFGGLPGVILKAELDSGRLVIEATEVDLKPVAAGLIRKPNQGKKMTEAQFKAMMDERRKEMGEGGDNIIIKVRN